MLPCRVDTGEGSLRDGFDREPFSEARISSRSCSKVCSSDRIRVGWRRDIVRVGSDLPVWGVVKIAMTVRGGALSGSLSDTRGIALSLSVCV